MAQENANSCKDNQTKEDRKKHRNVQKRRLSFTDVAGKEDKQLPPPDSDLWQKVKEHLELPEDESNTPSRPLMAEQKEWNRRGKV